MEAIKYNKFMLVAATGQIVVDSEKWSPKQRFHREQHFMYALGLKFNEYLEKYPDDCLARLRAYANVIINMNHPHLKNHLQRDTACFLSSVMRVNNVECPIACYECGAAKRKNGKKLKKCSGCKCAWYCSEKCQKSDWLRHKLWCYQDPDRVSCGVCEKPTKITVSVRFSNADKEICSECYQIILDEEKKQKDQALREEGVPI